MTPQRELVLAAVRQLDHGSPEEILSRVRESAKGVNISTVYRTLELLEKLGLVSHTHLGHGAPAYHATTEPDHLHLVCRDGGRADHCGRAGRRCRRAVRVPHRSPPPDRVRHLQGVLVMILELREMGWAGVGEVVCVLRLT